jgi:hypothetical protein
LCWGGGAKLGGMSERRSTFPGLRVHWSVLPIALLLIWELASGLLPPWYPGTPPPLIMS